MPQMWTFCSNLRHRKLTTKFIKFKQNSKTNKEYENQNIEWTLSRGLQQAGRRTQETQGI
jgi:hypothetical protein